MPSDDRDGPHADAGAGGGRGSLRSVTLAAGVGGVVLLAAYVLGFQALSGGRPAGTCTGIGFGCRPSPMLTIGLAVGMTAPPWLALLGAAAWTSRRRGGTPARLLTWASVAFAAGVALWVLVSVAP